MAYMNDTFKLFSFFFYGLISDSYFVNNDNNNYSSNSAVDLSEVSGKDQMDAQPVKKGRGRKQ
jgi:hypothetical protein